MSAFEKTAELCAHIQKTLERLEEVERFYADLKKDEASLRQNHAYDLIVLANVFNDFYTILETLFVRVSKTFENNLERDRWHSHLLEKMTLDIPAIRPRVISDTVYSGLLEFLKFRHFKRYYFEFEYDRERMDYLEKKFNTVIPLLKSDLQNCWRNLYAVCQSNDENSES
ncbi:MAG: hypothetical protein ACRC46_12445 [Thermoguttaceae bacterium]